MYSVLLLQLLVVSNFPKKESIITQRTIWGFEVETTPKGKSIWPYDPKREVVKRILDEDQHIGTIVAKIGDHEYLVENGVWRQ